MVRDPDLARGLSEPALDAGSGFASRAISYLSENLVAHVGHDAAMPILDYAAVRCDYTDIRQLLRGLAPLHTVGACGVALSALRESPEIARQPAAVYLLARPALAREALARRGTSAGWWRLGGYGSNVPHRGA